LDTEEKEIDLDIDKQYVFDKEIHIEQIDDQYVIIDINNANWIALQNVCQLEIFGQLQQQTIGQVLEQYMSSICTEAEENAFMEDFLKVLTEIEAKEFEKNCNTRLYHDGLTLYLTNRCNLRCVHCFMYSGNALDNELTTKEIFDIINQFKKLGGSGVTFSGGEVTEREDLVEILTYSKKLGLKNIVLTNGVNWKTDLIDDTTPLIDEIQVSIDGYDEKSNARVRGSGVFDKAIHTVREFLERKSAVRIAITPMLDLNEDEKLGYIKFAQSLLEKFYDKNLVIKFNKTTLNGREVRPDAKENAFYSSCIDEIIEACYPGSAIQDFVENHRDNTIFNNCGYGGITIAANGDIHFCNRIHDVPCFGNIREIDFSELMKLSRKVREVSNIDNLEPCNSCELRYICGGGCRIEYFKELVENTDFSDNVNKCRICTPEYKAKLYRFMMESNEHLYR
jgi:radical SAM protein with 4Fe4S-binding SPASM domain